MENSPPCPEQKTLETLHSSIQELQLTAIYLIANQDDLAISKLKNHFHPKSKLKSAVTKLSLQLELIPLLHTYLPDLTQSMLILENISKENKATILLKEAKKREIVVHTLDVLSATIATIHQQFPHCKQ